MVTELLLCLLNFDQINSSASIKKKVKVAMLKKLNIYFNFSGWCWPGASYYPDFLKPEAREYFSEQYMLDNYKGSTLDLFTWNDMNEPSVFNGPEVTMPKDLMHVGNVEHREMHNIYGHLYVMGTHAGHLKRSENQLRPFILTRSAFAGTQRSVFFYY